MQRYIGTIILVILAIVVVTGCVGPQQTSSATPVEQSQQQSTVAATEAQPTVTEMMETPTAVATKTEATAPAEETPQATTGQGQEVQVEMKNVSFQPQEITISPGTKVTWINQDNFGHTVTSGTRDNPTNLFDSGNVKAGDTFSFTFDKPGTYPYFCSIHQGMDGTVIVK